jgi:excisionase family DNA binding protein
VSKSTDLIETSHKELTMSEMSLLIQQISHDTAETRTEVREIREQAGISTNVLDSKQVATRLGGSRETVMRMVKDKQLPMKKLRGEWIIPSSVFYKWLDEKWEGKAKS